MYLIIKYGILSSRDWAIHSWKRFRASLLGAQRRK